MNQSQSAQAVVQPSQTHPLQHLTRLASFAREVRPSQQLEEIIEPLRTIVSLVDQSHHSAALNLHDSLEAEIASVLPRISRWIRHEHDLHTDEGSRAHLALIHLGACLHQLHGILRQDEWQEKLMPQSKLYKDLTREANIILGMRTMFVIPGTPS